MVIKVVLSWGTIGSELFLSIVPTNTYSLDMKSIILRELGSYILGDTPKP